MATPKVKNKKGTEANVLAGKKLILGQIGQTLDLLEKHFEKYCDEVAPHYLGQKATAVPLVYIKESFKRTLENLKKGAGV